MIDPDARVSADSQIHETAKVWQFSSVIRGASVGAECVIGAGACIDGARLGERCLIGANANLFHGLLIGDDVFIGPGATVCNDAWPRTHKDGFSIESFDGSRWSVVIESGASVGAGAVVLPGVRIGANAMVAAGERVTKNVPPGALWIDGHWRHMAGEKKRMRFVD